MEKVAWFIRWIKDVFEGIIIYKDYKDVDYSCLGERTRKIIWDSIACGDVDTCDRVLNMKVHRNYENQTKYIQKLLL